MEELKPTMLFIHGEEESHKVWEYQLKVFEDAIAIDLIGHDVGVGKSTIDEYAEEVRRFCDEKSLRKIVMIGHSMSGAVAQKLALNHLGYLGAISARGARRVLRKFYMGKYNHIISKRSENEEGRNEKRSEN